MKLADEVRNKIQKDMLVHLRNINAVSLVNLELYTEIMRRGEKVKIFESEVEIPKDTAFVLADLAPQCNWAHPCQFYLHDAQTGELYKKVDSSFPPPQYKQNPESVERFYEPVKLINTQTRPFRQKTVKQPQLNLLTNQPGERYAILFSGASNNRHVNDLEFLYRTLIDVYAYNPANIYVLNHDGTINYDGGPKPVGNWPGDNTAYRMIVNGQGTRAAFQETLKTLSRKIKPKDCLFIHTNNHGAGPCDDKFTDYCLCVYTPTHDWVGYYVNDFISDLGVLPKFEMLLVMMEQCRSGGFILPIINNSPASRTHVATAVDPDDYSLGGADFDPFAEDWIAAIAGQYPNGGGLAQVVDTSGDGRVSAAEAFAYADAVHTYDGHVAGYCGNAPLRYGDTPTASDKSAGCGDSIFLDSCACGKPQEEKDVLYQYAVKFVCGKSRGDILAPGEYWTAINVHNPTAKAIRFRKKIAIALPGERPGPVTKFFDAGLGPDQALEIDRKDIFGHTEQKVDFLKGFVIIESERELDVVAVYTAAGEGKQVTTMQVECVFPRPPDVGKPDLIPVPNKEGSFCKRDGNTLIVTVKNQGTRDAGTSVTVVDFGRYGKVTQPTPSLAPNASVDLSFPIPRGCHDPDCEFDITVDADDDVNESDEGNNTASGTCVG